MTPIPKSYSKAPLVAGADILFTATHPTIVGSVIGTTTNGAPRSGSVGILRTGATDVDWVSRLIPVASGASANLIPAKLSMDIGDALVVNASGQAVGQRILSELAASNGCWPTEPNLFLSNPDGSKIVAALGADGIWLSEDGQITARKVYTGTVYNQVGAWFAGKFRIYTSATTSLTSADGVSWATEVCVNAPTSTAVNALDNTITKGAELYGATADQLKKSTDGLTFTNHGVAVGGMGSANGFAWTGTNWVASGGGATQLVKYASETAGTWTVSTAPITGFAWSGLSLNGRSVVANGGTVLVVGGLADRGTATGDTLFSGHISTDHGVTFSAISQASPGIYASLIAVAGKMAVIGSTSNCWLYGNSSWLTTSNSSDGGFVATSSGTAFAINSNGLIAPGKRSVDASLSRRGGFTVTANVLEMQP